MNYHIAVGLNDIENRLEHLVEGAFGRFSRKGIHPSEIGKKLSRHMELEKRIGVRGPLVPNDYLVALSSSDWHSLSDIATALNSELLALVQQTAKEHRYKFVGFPALRIEIDEDLPRGTFAIESRYIEDPDYLGHLYLEMPNGLRVPITEKTITVGRLPSCAVVIDDPKISRNHAEISLNKDGVVTLRDLESTNGTKVNGRRISQISVDDGDVIEFGVVRIKVGRQ